MSHHDLLAPLMAAGAFPTIAEARPPKTIRVAAGASLGDALARSGKGDTIEIAGRHYWRDIPAHRDGLVLRGSGTLVVVNGPIRSQSVAHVEGLSFEMADRSIWYDTQIPWPKGSSIENKGVTIRPL